MTDPALARAIERVCALGCRRVWGVIEALREGRERPEYTGLDAGQRRALLAELESIMAVYRRCRSDD